MQENKGVSTSRIRGSRFSPNHTLPAQQTVPLFSVAVLPYLLLVSPAEMTRGLRPRTLHASSGRDGDERRDTACNVFFFYVVANPEAPACSAAVFIV